MKVTIELVVDLERLPLPDLVKKIEQRVYTIDGVSDANARIKDLDLPSGGNVVQFHESAPPTRVVSWWKPTRWLA